MTRFLIPAALALSLGACASVPGGIPQVSQTQVSDAIAKVQQVTAATCRFVPTAETIARVVSTFTGTGPFVDLASSVANGICNAIASPKMGRRGRSVPIYRGVVIRGHRI